MYIYYTYIGMHLKRQIKRLLYRIDRYNSRYIIHCICLYIPPAVANNRVFCNSAISRNGKGFLFVRVLAENRCEIIARHDLSRIVYPVADYAVYPFDIFLVVFISLIRIEFF